MGDFDRLQTAPGKQDNRKALAALVLAVVLVAMAAHWCFGRPAAAGAASPPPLLHDDGTTPAALATLHAELNNDPTASLLRSSAKPDVIRQIPRNPFRMSPDWVALLGKTTPLPEPPKPDVQTATPERAVASTRPESPAIRASDYRLQGTFNLGGWEAIVNHKVVRVGDVIDKAQVVEIREDAVVVRHVDYPDGPRTALAMPGR